MLLTFWLQLALAAAVVLITGTLAAEVVQVAF
jgi:hypothetical protein